MKAIIKSGFKVSFNKVKVTPSKPVYLAGLKHNRLSKGVHDDLYARCMLLSFNDTLFALVGVDSIGLVYKDTSEIKEKLSRKGVYAIISSTHDHSSPDTIGLWGPNPEVSGVDLEYLEFLKESIIECVEKALEKLVPAKLAITSTRIPEGVAVNGRDPGLMDKEITVITAETYSGEKLGILVNFGLHPEVLWNDNLLLTADYPFYMLSTLEREYGGVGVFLNGALGGMITPDVKEHSFKEAERVGVTIAEEILNAVKSPPTLYTTASLTVISKEVSLPVLNKKFVELAEKGVIRKIGVENTRTRSIVSYFKISPLLEGVSMPGEPLPKVGLKIKSLLHKPFKMLIGLGDDEIGYVIDPEDWTEGKYEESMSLGPDTATILTREIMYLIEISRNV